MTRPNPVEWDVFTAEIERLQDERGACPRNHWNQHRTPGLPAAQSICEQYGATWQELTRRAGLRTVHGPGRPPKHRQDSNGESVEPVTYFERLVALGLIERVPHDAKYGTGLTVCRVREVGRWIYMEVR